MDLDRLETLGRAVDEQPDDVDGWLALAEALLDHRVSDFARAMMTRAQGCDFTRSAQWKLLAELALRLNDRATAKDALRQAVKTDANDRPTIAWFARIALEDNDAQAAADVLRAALARSDDPELRRWLAEAEAMLGPPPLPTPPAKVASNGHVRQSLATLAEDESASFTGDLSVFSLPEMLEFLAQRRSSGTLQVLNDQHSANVWLSDGKIVDVEHARRPSLISLVAEQTPKLAPRLRTLPVEVMSDETALSRLLIHEGLIDEGGLEEILRRRIEDGIYQVLRWKDAYGQFRASTPDDGSKEGYDTHWILLAVLKRIDEEGR